MSESRKQLHKFSSKKDDKANQRRNVNIQLRKTAREEQQQKRRNLEDVNTSPLKSPPKTGSTVSPLRESNANKTIELGNTKLPLNKILELFQSPIQKDQLIAVTATRRLLSQDDRPPVKKVIQAGLVPTLVTKLDDRNHQVRYEACWALTNIASGTPEETLVVAKSGAIPKLVKILSENNDDLVDQAVWALGNIAGDGAHLRDMVLNCGTVPGIMSHIRSDKKIDYLRNLTWMISNLCRNKPAPRLELIGPLLEPLNCLVAFNDPQTQTDASWAVSYITDSTPDHVDAVCSFDRPHSLLHQLLRNAAGATGSDGDKLLTPTIRALGNIVTGTDSQTQLCLDSGFLQVTKQLLNHRKKNIVKEVVWALSNVTAGTPKQAQAVVDHGIMPDIIGLLSSPDAKIQKEACWAVSNLLTTNSVTNVNHCLQYGVISGFGMTLKCPSSEVLICSLDGITKILEVGSMQGSLEAISTEIEEQGVLDLIEALQENENEEVYKKSNNIIENYFYEDEEVGAATDQQGYFQFDAGQQQPSNTFAF